MEKMMCPSCGEQLSFLIRVDGMLSYPHCNNGDDHFTFEKGEEIQNIANKKWLEWHKELSQEFRNEFSRFLYQHDQNWNMEKGDENEKI